MEKSRIKLKCVFIFLIFGQIGVNAQDARIFNSDNILFEIDHIYDVFVETYILQRNLGFEPTISNAWEKINGVWFNYEKWIIMEWINGDWWLRSPITYEQLNNLRGKFVTMTTKISNELGFPPEVLTRNNEIEYSWGYSNHYNINKTINLFIAISNDNLNMMIQYVKFNDN